MSVVDYGLVVCLITTEVYIRTTVEASSSFLPPRASCSKAVTAGTHWNINRRWLDAPQGGRVIVKAGNGRARGSPRVHVEHYVLPDAPSLRPAAYGRGFPSDLRARVRKCSDGKSIPPSRDKLPRTRLSHDLNRGSECFLSSMVISGMLLAIRFTAQSLLSILPLAATQCLGLIAPLSWRETSAPFSPNVTPCARIIVAWYSPGL